MSLFNLRCNSNTFSSVLSSWPHSHCDRSFETFGWCQWSKAAIRRVKPLNWSTPAVAVAWMVPVPIKLVVRTLYWAWIWKINRIEPWDPIDRISNWYQLIGPWRNPLYIWVQYCICTRRCSGAALHMNTSRSHVDINDGIGISVTGSPLFYISSSASNNPLAMWRSCPNGRYLRRLAHYCAPTCSPPSSFILSVHRSHEISSVDRLRSVRSKIFKNETIKQTRPPSFDLQSWYQ